MYANENSGDWKEHIITDEPEQDETKNEDEDPLREVKARIIELVEEGMNQRQELIENLWNPEEETRQALKELKQENVLKVKKKVEQ